MDSLLETIREVRRTPAEAVELRLDALDNLPSPDQLVAAVSEAGDLDTIVTCRPARQGGRFEGDESPRLQLLRQAAEGKATWIDIEDDVPLQHWPDPAKVIISHHDFQRCPPDLDGIVRRMEQTPAAVVKVAFAAEGPQDALRALDVLRNAKKPAIALAMGEPGLASRILAGKFGAFGTFAALSSGEESAPGQPTIHELIGLYRWDAIGPETQLMGVIGCPVAHSMSPAIHNASFCETHVDAVYVPLRVEPGEENFLRLLDAIVARPWLHWRGLSVTVPHKENALRYVGEDRCDPLAGRIGAVNTVTIDQAGRLRGDNTDYAAAIDALCTAMDIQREDLAGRKVSVLGAGGAARAIVAALAHYHANVTVCNRTLARAEALAGEFDAAALPLDQAGTVEADIVINCTARGMHLADPGSPIDRIPAHTQMVFDTIYNPPETELLRLARRAGAQALSGIEMFVGQGARQFELWTGRPAPTDVMKREILSRLDPP